MSSPCVDFSTLPCLLYPQWAGINQSLPPATAPFLQMIAFITTCVFSVCFSSPGQRACRAEASVFVTFGEEMSLNERQSDRGERALESDTPGIKLFLCDKLHNLLKLWFLTSKVGRVVIMRTRNQSHHSNGSCCHYCHPSTCTQ